MGDTIPAERMASSQPTTVKFLATEFRDLDRKWIEELVAQFPTAQIEFYKEQCVQKCVQLFAEKEQKDNQNKQPMDDEQDDQERFFYPNLNVNQNLNNSNEQKQDEKKQANDDDDNANDNAPDLPKEQLTFLYAAYIDSEDVCSIISKL